MLSKSDLQSLAQCPRRLWLEHYRPDLRPPEDSSWNRRAVDGKIVGEKAREQLGEGFVWPPGDPDHSAAAAIAREQLNQNPGRSAAEFPMVHEGLYARADALIAVDGGFTLRETKASTFPLKPDKVTPKPPEEHLVFDVAIQAWVMEGMGLPVRATELNLLNNQWCYPGGNDYAGLFRQMDVTGDIEKHKAKVPALLEQARAVLVGEIPDAQTGRHCNEPYACPYTGFCKELDPPGPEHPVELLPGSAGKALARRLRDKGYESLLDVPPEELTGSDAALYRRMQAAHRAGDAVFEAGSDAKLAELGYPRYFFDFEGIDLPVPRWPGLRPYEQAPFQWSCHIERAPGMFEHQEFMDLTGEDPSLACIEQMRLVIPDDGGPIFVYNKTYEATVLKNLAIRHPEHEALVQRYVERLVDLLPFVKDHFYHPTMEGSFSIKKVLPVIAPDLDYGELDEVQEGTAAQVAYLYAVFDPDTTPQRRAELDRKLRVYCRLDTWAMVEVAHFLARWPRPGRPEEM